MARGPSEEDDGSRPTVAGCLLLLLSLAVIGGAALLVVRWRDPVSGLPLPQEIAMVVPVLAGALCCAIGTGLLRVLGLSVLTKPKRQSSDRPKDLDASEKDEQTRGERDPAADRPRET
jgi:hypothetical protein